MNFNKSIAVVIITMVIASCTNSKKNELEIKNQDSVTSNIKKEKMQNLVSIIEIPTLDLKRAIRFYSSILNTKIDEVSMGEVSMGVIPSDEGTVNVVLAKGADYKPSDNGSVIYLHGGEDLLVILNKIEENGGKILVPKSEISPEMGYFALFTDTEGNKLGLHSQK